MTDTPLTSEQLNEKLTHEKQMRLRVEREATQFQEAEIERLFWKDIAQRAQAKKKSIKANPDLLEATRKIRTMSSRIQELLEKIKTQDAYISEMSTRISSSPKGNISHDLIFDLQTDLPGLDQDLPTNLGAIGSSKELQSKNKKLRAENQKRRNTITELRSMLTELQNFKRSAIAKDVHKQKIDKLSHEVAKRREYSKRLETEMAKQKKAREKDGTRFNTSIKKLRDEITQLKAAKRESISKAMHKQKIDKLSADIKKRQDYGKRLEAEIKKTQKSRDKKLETLKASLQKLKDEAAALKTFKHEAVSKEQHMLKVEKLTAEIDRRRNYANRLEEEIKKLREKNNLANNKTNKTIDVLRQDIEKLKLKNTGLQTELTKRKTTVDSLRALSDKPAMVQPTIDQDISGADEKLKSEIMRLKINNKKFIDEIAKQRDTIRWLRGEE